MLNKILKVNRYGIYKMKLFLELYYYIQKKFQQETEQVEQFQFAVIQYVFDISLLNYVESNKRF